MPVIQSLALFSAHVNLLLTLQTEISSSSHTHFFAHGLIYSTLKLVESDVFPILNGKFRRELDLVLYTFAAHFLYTMDIRWNLLN